MEGNWVAKHSHKYNKHVVHRDKTKIRPKKRMSLREIEYELEEEDRDITNSHGFSPKVERPVGNQ